MKFILLCLLTSTLHAQSEYKKVPGVTGNLNSIGSDTLNNLMTLWAEGFRKIYPGVIIQVEGKGSSTAPPALIAGTAQLAPMSRAMKNREIEAFEKKFNFKPTAISVAIDTLAVYVHKDNPIEGLSLPQVKKIFGHGGEILTWGDAGVNKWKNKPISIYGRNSASGTYGFFKKAALKGSDFKNSVKEQPGSASVVNSIGTDLASIGYSGIGYKTSDVKVLKISMKDGGKLVDATFDNALNRSYPLARSLHIYIAKKPNTPLPKLTLEFLKFILSKKGQEIVEKDGYGALPSRVIKLQLDKLNK